MSQEIKQDNPIMVKESEASLVCCPPINSPVWNMHPRVYLSFNDKHLATCPYCSAEYKIG